MLKLLLVAALAVASIGAAPPAPTPAQVLKGNMVVELDCYRGLGSGTRVAPGVIVTAAHVAEAGACMTDSGPATIAADFHMLDVAVLTTADLPRDLAPISCEPLAVGAKYVAFGYAKGGPLRPMVVTGVGTGRSTPDSSFDGAAAFAGAAQFIPGMSGGPIFNLQGQVVGVVMGYHTKLKTISFGRMLADTPLCQGGR